METFFFCVCMYMGGQLKNRFSFWVAINIILKFLLMEAHQCWRIRPARLHCTPLHARFFSGGFVSFWVQYVISGFISRDSPVIQKIKKLPYPHTNLAWSPCMHFLKVLSESVWQQIKAFPFGNNFINSCYLFSWRRMDILRRKLMLVFSGAFRV